MSDDNPNVISRNPEGLYDRDLRVQQRIDIGAATIYVGRAALGTATNAAAWLIKRVTLVPSGPDKGNPTAIEWTSTTAVWDNRATETFS